MNPNRGIWSDLPMAAGIATLVCYAGVFHDVIGIEEMAAKLGVSGQDEFYRVLNELQRKGRIVLRNGFAGLPDLGEKIDLKVAKIERARELINSRLDELRRIGHSPIIKFLGISGSLAANNPTQDRENRIDIDLFLVTRSQCLWLYIIPRNIRNLFPRKITEPVLCDNFIMDESSLRVTNRNFFTATDIRNLIPVCGQDTFRKFIQVNNWVDYYYPGFSGTTEPLAETPSGNLINKAFFVLYTALFCVKHLTVKPLLKFSFQRDPQNSVNVDRLGAHCGGYQALVQKKFSRLAATWFPDLVDAKLIETLFPDELSANIRKGDLDTVKIRAALSQLYDYSKYA